MTSALKTDVLIVGAGPVGLTLGMILAQRGVAVTIVETRHRGEPPNVKCNHVSARSMEILRRLGVADAARNAGLPEDYANDIAYRTSMTGKAITRIPIPCRRDRFTATGGPDTDWPTAEPPHRINQLFLEPILFEQAVAMPGLTVLNRTEYLSCTETGDGIQISARNIDSGEQTTISARYLAGCDGGRSQVRRDIGAKLVGDAVVQRVQSTYIRAPQLLGLMNDQPAWASFSLNPRRSGNVYAIDGRETWLVHKLSARTTNRISTASTVTGRSARSSASARTFPMKSCPTKTGSAAASSPTASRRAVSSSAATQHTFGSLTPATA